MAFSSSFLPSISLQPKYDVFLSFRGDDTRYNFTSHLYAALCQKQIQTFMDDDGLNRGDDISSELYEAIEQSKIAVVIFSKNYASSTWCLDELIKILECKEKKGLVAMPVFYQITPSDVRKQIRSFKDAFVEHEKQFKKPVKVRRWKAALTEASNLSGWDSMVIRPESKLVKVIVKEIMKRLNEVSPMSNEYDGLVGINSRMERIKSLLGIGLSDVRIIGVWGMGGIGKTTLVGALFDQISNKFESSCFIEMSERYGPVFLQRQILSQLLGEENLTIGTSIIPQYIKKRLQSKKVLIVLDDVNDLGHLEFLTMGIDQFGQGSRVFITTRDKQVLDNFGVDSIYEVDRLKYHEAIQLFSNFAFKQESPTEDFLELSQQFVDYAQGNPLALKVLGSSIYRKTKVHWEGVLKKLRRIANPKIHDILKSSYHGLDREVQDIFLDIACFFNGYDSNNAEKILSSCYLSTEVGFSTLIDKSLMTISHSNMLEMHDLLQEMGRQIVSEESPKEPGKRSRVWNHEDAFHILKNNTGTGAVQGLFLDMSKITDLHLSAWAFEKMSNLKFLKFYAPHKHIQDSGNINKLLLPQGLKCLPDELRYLCWHGYPLKTLPSNSNPKNLIELDLSHGSVDETLWLEKKYGSEVKLIEPNLSDAPEPQHCQSLLYSPSCIQYLTNLRSLTLYGCKSLRSFPSNIHFGSLITLDLSYCSNLATFPQISGNIKELLLTGTAIDEVPSSIACLTELSGLSLWNCKRLKRISSGIYKLKYLRRLSLWRYRISRTELSSTISCWKEMKKLSLAFCNLLELPEELFCLSSLERLDICGNKFESLPKIMKQHSRLRTLFLDYCDRLQSIPELPITLKLLSAMDCIQLQSLPELPSNLEELGEAELEISLENVLEWGKWNGYCFIFTNCLRLNQNADNNILTDSQQRIQLMVTTALRLRLQKVFDKIPRISLCLPGNIIPEWFSHQSLGTSITIELPEHCCNKRLIGFSLSAVVTFDENFYKDFCDVGVVCIYSSANNVKFNWISSVNFPDDVYISVESDHIVVGYSPFISNGKSENTTVSFEFSTHDFGHETADTGCKVKCCGVHPLYIQPNITKPDTTVERFAATSEGSGETMLADTGLLMELPDTSTNENVRISDEEEGAPNANTGGSLRGSGLSLCSCWTSIISLF